MGQIWLTMCFCKPTLTETQAIFIHVLSMAAFTLQQQRWVGATESIGHKTENIYIWLLKKKTNPRIIW